MVLGQLGIGWFTPVGWVTASPLVVLLLRLGSRAGSHAGWYFRLCAVLGALAALGLYVARGAGSPTAPSAPQVIGELLIGPGLLLFCRGMQRWLSVYDNKTDLARRWRRSELWAWPAAALAVPGTAWVLWRAWHDDSARATVEAHGAPGLLLMVGAAVVLLGPLFSVASSASVTRDALNRHLDATDGP